MTPYQELETKRSNAASNLHKVGAPEPIIELVMTGHYDDALQFIEDLAHQMWVPAPDADEWEEAPQAVSEAIQRHVNQALGEISPRFVAEAALQVIKRFSEHDVGTLGDVEAGVYTKALNHVASLFPTPSKGTEDDS